MSLIILNVDEVRRTLSVSDASAFVVNDKNVDIVRFALMTGFVDIALDEHSALRVMYQRPGETQVRAQTLTYYDTDGIRNYYDWELLSADLAEKGTLNCALCILRTDAEVEEWHTTPYQIRVLDSIHTDDSDEADETITPTVAQRVAVLETMIQQVASGAPIVVASTSAMTDTDQIYVLSTDGEWYYHNGTAWVAGGEYGAVATDTTLTQSGIPADAKKVGDELSDIKADLDDVSSDIDEIAKIGKQLFDKDNAETEHWAVTDGVAYASTYLTSVIIPVNPSESDEYITVHRNTITSRFRVSTFTAKPAVGSTAVDTTIAQNNAPAITVACDTTIKYIMVVFHHSTDDASITVQTVLDGLMVEFGASYTGYEPYSLRVIIPTKSVDGDSFSDDGIGFITDIVDAKTEAVQTLADANKHQMVGKTDVTLTWTEGSYYNLATGEITALSGKAYSAKVDCKAGDRISVTNNKGQILYWKADGSFVSYSATGYPSTMTYVVPADVTKFALNSSDSTIRASIATVRADGSELITKTYDAPARLIFDSDAFEQGKYCSTSNGKISSLSSYWCLPFVPVKPNHKYRTEDQTQVVFYGATGEFLSALLPNGSASWTGVDTEMDFTTPANCAYISVNAQNAHEKLFDMEPYTVVGDVINPQKLHGKTVVCFGDSITGNYGFGDNYPYQIERLTGAKTYNCGFGGCRMELLNNDAQHTNPFSMCGIVDALEAAKNGDSTAWDEQDEYAVSISKMVYLRLQILKAIDWSKVDIVTIAYGTNEGGYPQDDEENPTNKYTYGGATRYAVNKLLTLYPHLRIVLLTPIYRFYTSEGVDSDTHTHPTYGGKLTDNVETLIKVGGELKVPVLDLYHTLGINITNYTSYFGDEDEQYDGTHINSFGREQMGRRVAGELNRLF